MAIQFLLKDTPYILIDKGDVITLPVSPVLGDFVKMNGMYYVYRSDGWAIFPSKETMESAITNSVSGYLTQDEIVELLNCLSEAITKNASELSVQERNAVIEIVQSTIIGLESVTVEQVTVMIANALATLVDDEGNPKVSESTVQAIINESLVAIENSIAALNMRTYAQYPYVRFTTDFIYDLKKRITPEDGVIKNQYWMLFSYNSGIDNLPSVGVSNGSGIVSSFNASSCNGMIFGGASQIWAFAIRELTTDNPTITWQKLTLDVDLKKIDADLDKHIKSDSDIYQSIYSYIDKKLTNPEYNMDSPIVIIGNNGVLSLLSTPQDWVSPGQGMIRIIYKALLGVAPIVLKNGEPISGGLSLLGSGTPVDITCLQGDVFTFSGVLGILDSFTVYYYQSI